MDLKPSLTTLWLADDVIQDPGTGKVTVAGLFDKIEVERPATHFSAPAFLFFSITNIHSRVDLALRFVDLGDLSVLVDRPLSVAAGNPLECTDVRIAAPKMPIPHAGVFVWELWWQNEVIGSLNVTAEVS